ncbi:MAG: hypothetical protein ACFFB3_20600, partial [Candidatus Hodarchaeota archaeon]
MMLKEVRKRFKAIKAKAADLDSSGDRKEAGDAFYEFAKELIVPSTNLSRHIRRIAAQACYQALIRYLLAGQTRKMNALVEFVENHQLSELSYQLEETINRTREFLEGKDWDDIGPIAEGVELNQIEAIEKANELLKSAKYQDSKGNYLSAAENYMKASRILFSALEGEELSKRSKKPVKNAILRLVMADEWEMASDFISTAQSHSIPVDRALKQKVESRKRLIEQYIRGEREIRVLAKLDLRGIDDPEETVGRVMRDGFPFSLDEYKEIDVLSAWRLDYLRGVVPVELGDICPESTKDVPVKRLIGSVHDNYGADTLMLDFKTPHFAGAMV